MDKAEAIHAMRQGRKVTHEHFSRDEWMTAEGHYELRLEDGVVCSMNEFFKWRTDESWETGYSLWEPESDCTEIPVGDGEHILGEQFTENAVYEFKMHEMYNDLPDAQPLKYGTYQKIRTEPKIGRNEPCPCGSGKKYKKCCITK